MTGGTLWLVVGAVAAVVMALIWVAVRWGKAAQRSRQAEDAARSARRMLDAQTGAPRDREALVRHLEDGKF